MEKVIVKARKWGFRVKYRTPRRKVKRLAHKQERQWAKRLLRKEEEYE